MLSPIDQFGTLPAGELRELTERSIAALLNVLLVCLNPAAASEASRKALRSDLRSVAAGLQEAAERISS